MLDEIADHKFDMAPRFKQEPRDIADVVNWYETNFLRAANRVRAMTPEQLATPVDFARVFKMPAVFLSRLGQQPFGPPSRATRRLPAAHGLKGSFDL
jgi:hypothetical protein